MSKPSQKKATKRKEREKEVAAKMHRRRIAKLKHEKAQREWEAKLEAETNPTPVKKRPFRYDDPHCQEGTEESKKDQEKAAEIKAKLEHNLAILRELEKEYQAEQRAKLDVNQKLEAEGHLDFKSKLDALQQQTLADIAAGELQGQSTCLSGGDRPATEEVPLQVESEEIKAKEPSE